MDISVIVPFYNAGNFFAACLDALVHQTFPHTRYEILLVDNNSRDHSRALVEAVQRESVASTPDLALRVLEERTQGAYAARNCAIRHARGRILAFTDPDCVVSSDWLEQIYGALQDSRIGIVMGYRHYANASRLMRLLAAYEAEKARWVMSGSEKLLYYGFTNNMAVQRWVLDKLGLFPERPRGGDTIFVRQAVDVFGTRVIAFCPGMQVRHLEVASVRDYYRKRSTYGKSNETLSHQIPFRPLRWRERWLVFQRVVAQHKLSPFSGLVLLALLIPGALLYELGRERGKSSKE